MIFNLRPVACGDRSTNYLPAVHSGATAPNGFAADREAGDNGPEKVWGQTLYSAIKVPPNILKYGRLVNVLTPVRKCQMPNLKSTTYLPAVRLS